jgi:hypothetical protein
MRENGHQNDPVLEVCYPCLKEIAKEAVNRMRGNGKK